MSSATEYQSVPTTATQSESPRRRVTSAGIFILVLLCVGLGIPFIIFGVLEYMKVDNISTKLSYCRVNSIGTERKTEMKQLSRVFPVWNVDVVKQSKTNTEAKDLLVLRSNLIIKGPGDYKFPSMALEDGEQRYSVGKIYPCYVHKQLLDDTNNDKKEINLKYAAQWEKPTKQSSIALLAVGSILIVAGIIILIIGVFLHYRQ